MSGKPKEVSIATTIIVIPADLSRALTVCQALSPASHRLICFIFAKTLGGWLLLSLNLSKNQSPASVWCPQKKVKIRFKKYTLKDCGVCGFLKSEFRKLNHQGLGAQEPSFCLLNYRGWSPGGKKTREQ